MRKETYLLDMKIDQILTVVAVLSKYTTVTRLVLGISQLYQPILC